MRYYCTLFHDIRMRFEGGVAKIKFGMLRGRKVPPYTVVELNNDAVVYLEAL